MNAGKIKIILTDDILAILKLLSIINTKTPADILKERVLEMVSLPYYKYIGFFVDEKLSAITGLGYSTRHSIG
jgi:hypothetical protein